MRGGYGVFYERVSESLTMTAIRLNGVNQQQFTVQNPDFFPLIPTWTSSFSFQFRELFIDSRTACKRPTRCNQ